MAGKKAGSTGKKVTTAKKAPATPAKGSSPITPPAGTAKKPPQVGAKKQPPQVKSPKAAKKPAYAPKAPPPDPNKPWPVPPTQFQPRVPTVRTPGMAAPPQAPPAPGRVGAKQVQATEARAPLPPVPQPPARMGGGRAAIAAPAGVQQAVRGITDNVPGFLGRWAARAINPFTAAAEFATRPDVMANTGVARAAVSDVAGRWASQMPRNLRQAVSPIVGGIIDYGLSGALGEDVAAANQPVVSYGAPLVQQGTAEDRLTGNVPGAANAYTRYKPGGGGTLDPAWANVLKPGEKVVGQEEDEQGNSWYVVQQLNGTTRNVPIKTTRQPNILDKFGRILGSVAGRIGQQAMEPAEDVMRGVGAAAAITGLERVSKPVLLPDGTVYQPKRGLGPIGGQSLPEALRELHPDMPQEELDKLAYTVSSQLGYSGGARQLTAAERMLNGESLEQARYGNPDVMDDLIAAGWTADEDDQVKALQSTPATKYFYDRMKAQGKTNAEIADIIKTRGLPGEENLFTTAVLQSLLDPYNLLNTPMEGADMYFKQRRQAQMFIEPAQDMGQVMSDWQNLARPYKSSLANDIAPWVRTPSSVRDEVLQTASDGMSLVMRDVADKGLNRDVAISHMLTLSDPKATPEMLAAARKYFVDNQVPVAISKAGYTASWAMRSMLADDLGRVTGEAVKKILSAPDASVYEKAARLVDMYNDKMVGKLETALTPGRQGMNLEDWVLSGGEASKYPTFERGVAGAQEKAAQAARNEGFLKGLEGKYKQASDLAAGLKPEKAAKVMPQGLTLEDLQARGRTNLTALEMLGNSVGWTQQKTNSALWGVFAKYNPGFSMRNMLNNAATAFVDDVLEVMPRSEIDKVLDMVGRPVGASQAIGGKGVIIPTGSAAAVDLLPKIKKGDWRGFWGDLRKQGLSGDIALGGLPLGAQTIEREFSRMIVAREAQKFLDRTMVVGKGIPRLPETLANALGRDVVDRFYKIVESDWGDASRAMKWLQGENGAVEVWRALDPDELAALRAAGVDADALKSAAMKSATREEWEAAVDAEIAKLKAKAKGRVKVENRTEALSDLASNMTSDEKTNQEFAELFATEEDFAKQYDSPKIDDTFIQDRLAEQREAAYLRRKAEVESGHISGVKARGAGSADAATSVMEKTNKALKDVREAESTRAMQAHKEHMQALKDVKDEVEMLRSSLIPAAERNTLIDEAWKSYFDYRDNIWTKYRNETRQAWQDFRENYGFRSYGQANDDVKDAFRQAREDGWTPSDWANTSMESEWAGAYREYLDEWEAATRSEAQAAAAEVAQGRGSVVMARGTSGENLPMTTDRLALRHWFDFHQDSSGKWQARLKPGVDNSLEAQERMARDLIQVPITDLEKWSYQPGFELGDVERAASEAYQSGAAKTGKAKPGRRGAPKQKGAAAPATPAAQPHLFVDDSPEGAQNTLRRMKQRVSSEWGQVEMSGVSPDEMNALNAWTRLAAQKRAEATLMAGRLGVEARDFALLNYTKRTNFDSVAGMLAPYQYWYRGTYGNWAGRVLQKPALAASYMRYKENLKRAHAAMPEWWQQQISTDDLGIQLDNPLVANLEQMFSPLYGLIGQDYEKEAVNRLPGGEYMQTLGQLGPSWWAPMYWGMAAMNKDRDPEGATALIDTYISPHARVLRAATAAANKGLEAHGMPSGTPGGVNLDLQVYFAQKMRGSIPGQPGWSGMTSWEESRVMQTMGKYPPPPGVDPREWESRVVDQMHLKRGDIWDKAMNDYFASQFGPNVIGVMLGLGFKPRPQEQAEFSEIGKAQAQLRANYGNMTPEEIAQAEADNRDRYGPAWDYAKLMRGGAGKDSYVWEAFSRVGPGAFNLWEAAGVNQQTINNFLDIKTLDGMDPAQADSMYKAALIINGGLLAASPEERSRRQIAAIKKAQVDADLATRFPASVYQTEKRWQEIMELGGSEEGDKFLDSLAPSELDALQEKWQASKEALAGDEDLAAYYLEPERYRGLAIAQFYDNWEAQYPDVRELRNTWDDLAGDSVARSELEKAHPELKAFKKALDKFYKTELPQMVTDYADSLPRTEQFAPRVKAGVDRTMLTQDEQVFADSIREKLLEMAKRGGGTPQGVGEPDYFQREKAGGKGRPGEPPVKLKAPEAGAEIQADDLDPAYWTALADQKREADAARMGYVSQHRDEYGDAVIRPLIDKLGAESALAYMDTPVAQTWKVGGPPEFMADAKSFREALMVYASENGAAYGLSALGWVKNMTPAQLDVAVRTYDLPDLENVWNTLQEYDKPSLSALNDVLGLNVSINEDGGWSITAQKVKKPEPADVDFNLTKWIDSEIDRQWPGGTELREQYLAAAVADPAMAARLLADNPFLKDIFAFDKDARKRYSDAKKLKIGGTAQAGGGGGGGVAAPAPAREKRQRSSGGGGGGGGGGGQPEPTEPGMTRYGTFSLTKYIQDIAEQQWPGVIDLYNTWLRIAMIDGEDAAAGFWQVHPELAQYDEFRKSITERYNRVKKGYTSSERDSSGANLDPEAWSDYINGLAGEKGDILGSVSAWEKFMQTAPPNLVVAVKDYFDADQYTRAQMMANPETARILSMWRNYPGASELGYKAWSEREGRAPGGKRQGTTYSTTGPRIVRYYKPRGQKAGLSS